MHIFSSLTVYGSWNVAGEESFSTEDISAIESATVVPSQYGSSVCFVFKQGGKSYIPLANDSNLQVGDSVDLTKAKVLSLTKDGKTFIPRLSANK